MPLACFQCADKLQFAPKHAKGMSLRYGVIVLENLMRLFTKKSFYYQGFFAVKRRAVFILGEKWKVSGFCFWSSPWIIKGWGARKKCGGSPSTNLHTHKAM